MSKPVKADFRAICTGGCVAYRELKMTVQGETTQELVSETKRLIRAMLSAYVREVRSVHAER